MLKEFKKFIMRGNVIDLAIGIIIGGAFQKIVTSLVNDIVMPAISFLTGKVNISELGYTFSGITIKYGAFLSTVIDFLIIAFTIFIVIRTINKFNDQLKKVTKGKLAKNAETKTSKECPFCLSEINIKATRCPNCTSELTIKKKN